MNIFAAPMQGYTDNAFIEAHHAIYGGVDAYGMPFTRIEKGDVRRQDAARLHRAFEIASSAGVGIVPQVIFNSLEEFDTLVKAVKDAGFRRVDLNLGCPFPMQTRRGRGAAMISNLEVMGKVADAVNADSGTKYSVKMRLGLVREDEWREVMPLLDSMPLEYLAVHPRTASQMYDGTLHVDEFAELASVSANTVVYNGDILSRSDIEAVTGKCPSISGVMIGRGLLMRPSLGAEIASGGEWTLDAQRDKFARFHAAVLSTYESTLCGDTQILQKIKPLWDYISLDLDRKALKAIRKATSLAKYTTAVDAAL